MSTKIAINNYVLVLCALLAHAQAGASDQEKPSDGKDAVSTDSGWSYRLRLSKFERQFSTRDDNAYGEWAGFIRASRRLDSFWLTTKGSTQRAETDSSEIRLFYSRSIKSYLDVHLGWKHDIKPEPVRDWFSFGVLTILPYKVGADVSFFVGETGRLAARLEMAYRYAITQKLSLTPDLEANVYSEDDAERGIGSGLSDLDVGLRLRYRIVTGVSPYAGIVWKGNFGRTADIIESQGGEPADLRLMLGVTLWF